MSQKRILKATGGWKQFVFGFCFCFFSSSLGPGIFCPSELFKPHSSPCWGLIPCDKAILVQKPHPKLSWDYDRVNRGLRVMQDSIFAFIFLRITSPKLQKSPAPSYPWLALSPAWAQHSCRSILALPGGHKAANQDKQTRRTRSRAGTKRLQCPGLGSFPVQGEEQDLLRDSLVRSFCPFLLGSQRPCIIHSMNA